MKITLAPALAYHQIGKRPNQEDSLFPQGNALLDGESLSYFIVCDGVGGAEKGEVASNTVANSLGKHISRTSQPLTAEVFANVMTDVYADLENKMKEADTYDMATTLTFVNFDQDGVLAAHIGDSRIYHIRPGAGVLYRSDDHSLVNAMVKAGLITERQAETHPQRNVITRCVNHVDADADPPRATVRRIADVMPGDWFLACSDGVLHGVSDDDIVEILSDTTLSDIQKRDKFASMSKNSSDNNTLYMVRVANVENPLSGATEGKDVDIAIPLLQQKLKETNQNGGMLKNWISKIFKA